MATERTGLGPPTDWGRAFADLRGRLQLGRPDQFTEQELSFLRARYLQALYRLGVGILVTIAVSAALIVVLLLAVYDAASTGIL